LPTFSYPHLFTFSAYIISYQYYYYFNTCIPSLLHSCLDSRCVRWKCNRTNGIGHQNFQVFRLRHYHRFRGRYNCHNHHPWLNRHKRSRTLDRSIRDGNKFPLTFCNRSYENCLFQPERNNKITTFFNAVIQ